MYINQIIRFKGYNGFIIETNKTEIIKCIPKSSNSIMIAVQPYSCQCD